VSTVIHDDTFDIKDFGGLVGISVQAMRESLGITVVRLAKASGIPRVRIETIERGATTTHPRPGLGTPYVAPENETEQKIAAIWGELLGIEQIGADDRFFELGGHSLLGTQLISRLRQVFQVNLPLTIIFEYPTVAEMALAVELTLIEAIEKLSEDETLSLA